MEFGGFLGYLVFQGGIGIDGNYWIVFWLLWATWWNSCLIGKNLLLKTENFFELFQGLRLKVCSGVDTMRFWLFVGLFVDEVVKIKEMFYWWIRDLDFFSCSIEFNVLWSMLVLESTNLCSWYNHFWSFIIFLKFNT